MSLIQYAFRFFNDDGGESNSTAYGAENANVSMPLDTNVRLRIGITHDGGAAPSASKYKLFAAPTGTSKWFEVAVGGLGKVTMAVSGGSPNNLTSGGVNTSNRLSKPSVSPTPTFVAGRAWDDESGLDTVALDNGQFTELEFCIKSVSANGAINGDIYDFRVYRVPAGAAINPPTFDIAGTGVSTTNDANVSTSAFTIGAGSNRIAIAFVSWLSSTGPNTVTSVKQGTTDFTRLGGVTWLMETGADCGMDIWYLNDPASGSGTVAVVMNAATAVKEIGVQCYSGRNTSAALGAIGTNTGSIASATVVPASAVNDLVVGAVLSFSSATPASDAVIQGPAVNRFAIGEQVVEGTSENGGESAGAAGTTTITWTVDNTHAWGTAAVALKAA